MTEEQNSDVLSNPPSGRYFTLKASIPNPPHAPTPPKAPAPSFESQSSISNATQSTTPSEEEPLNLPALPQACPAKEPPSSFIKAAAQAVALSLGSTPYVIVGGAACTLLGSQRTTTDVDIVVMKGETKTARNKLAAQAMHFSVDPKTRHTEYLSSPAVQIEILTPPLLFRENFDEATPTVMVGYGIKVLKTTLFLNAKCRSILARATETRKASDAGDIKFLLAWCVSKKLWPTSGECTNINGPFVDWFVTSYGGGDLFKSAGWHQADGMLLPRH